MNKIYSAWYLYIIWLPHKPQIVKWINFWRLCYTVTKGVDRVNSSPVFAYLSGSVYELYFLWIIYSSPQPFTFTYHDGLAVMVHTTYLSLRLLSCDFFLLSCFQTELRLQRRGLTTTRSGHKLDFFLLPSCKKSLICLEGKPMTLCQETLFSVDPPSNSLVSVSEHWCAFRADTAPFKGPRLASCVASGDTQIQAHSQVCPTRRWGPRTLSRTTDANLDYAFVENTLHSVVPNIGIL